MSIRTRLTVIQQKTSRSVPFELTEPTRDAITNWMHRRVACNGGWLFPSRSNADWHLTTRQYAGMVDDWITMTGLTDLTMVQVCPLHMTPLISECPECQVPYNLSGDEIAVC
jgi:hypothetical protein